VVQLADDQVNDSIMAQVLKAEHQTLTANNPEHREPTKSIEGKQTL
jgi:hypothetical protein